jgi:hypothetical protein
MTVYVMMFMNHDINTTTSSHGMFKDLHYFSAVKAVLSTVAYCTAPMYSQQKVAGRCQN